MGAVIELSDVEWGLVKGLFDPPIHRGVKGTIPKRAIVDAILWLARTGCQWRHLPDDFPDWQAVWSQWRRWRDNGTWAAAMRVLAREIRLRHTADRGYTGLQTLANSLGLNLDIKVPPAPPMLPPKKPGGKPRRGKRTLTPLRPLYKVENAFARPGMWRRLSRCYEQTALGAQTWLEVACVALPVREAPRRADLIARLLLGGVDQRVLRLAAPRDGAMPDRPGVGVRRRDVRDLPADAATDWRERGDAAVCPVTELVRPVRIHVLITSLLPR